ncbi:MAG: 4Fe-4S dicluster domain-containing protein [Nitrospinota bacterium]
MARKRYAMLVDLDRCIGCHACSVACKSEMGISLGVWLSHVKYLENGSYPNAKRYFLRNQCNHCSNPPCVMASGGAMEKRADGVVLIKDPKSPNMRYAMMACPYHNISSAT